MHASGQGAGCLFVYGTLMQASGHPMAQRLASQSTVIGPGTVPGRLYDLGRYPGAVLDGAGGERVHGVALRLQHAERTLAWLDAYEGMGAGDPEPHAYARVVIAVQLSRGRQIDAWIYDYRGPLTFARRLASGRYFMPKPLARLRS
jgi:gamma-glutamylcyclotransferase (GGCT)/AIG2-like uncharacterized protein YtfP